MHRFTNLRMVSFLIFGFLSTNTFAQANCNVDPELDSNNDGYDDAFVSPDARIVRSDVDCSPHSIAAGAIIKDSGISIIVTIESDAKIVRSFVSNFATVGIEARIIDSSLDGEGSSVGARTVLRNRASVSEFSTVAEDSIINNSQIRQSRVGINNVIRDSQVTTFELGADNRITAESVLVGNSQFPSTLENGARINGAYIQGPISIGSDARIRPGVRILGSKNIGDNFRVGIDTTIGIGGDILSNVTIGERVTIENNPDIGFNNTIGSDAIIGFGVETLSNVIIRPFANIGEATFIDRDVIVGRSVVTGTEVQIDPDAVIRARATIGDFARIGASAIVRADSNVPVEFFVQDNTIFPDDYEAELISPEMRNSL